MGFHIINIYSYLLHCCLLILCLVTIITSFTVLVQFFVSFLTG